MERKYLIGHSGSMVNVEYYYSVKLSEKGFLLEIVEENTGSVISNDFSTFEEVNNFIQTFKEKVEKVIELEEKFC